MILVGCLNLRLGLVLLPKILSAKTVLLAIQITIFHQLVPLRRTLFVVFVMFVTLPSTKRKPVVVLRILCALHVQLVVLENMLLCLVLILRTLFVEIAHPTVMFVVEILHA